MLPIQECEREMFHSYKEAIDKYGSPVLYVKYLRAVPLPKLIAPTEPPTPEPMALGMVTISLRKLPDRELYYYERERE